MSVLLDILFLHFIAQITPGPDILLITKVTMIEGKKVAFFTVLGISLGISIWVILTLIGFGLLSQSWNGLQTIIMLLGGLFLFKMGWAMLKSKPNSIQTSLQIEPHHKQPYWQAFKQGLFTNLANPKALIYFGSIFSFAIQSAQLQNIKWLLAGTIIIETFFVFLSLAWLLSHPKIQPYYQNNKHYIDKIAGVCFVGFATILIFDAIKGLIMPI